MGKTIHLLAPRRYEEAGQNASLHLEFHRERPAEYCESMVRAQAAGVAAVQGEPGKGLAAYLSEVALRARRGDRYVEAILRVLLADTYVRIADREVVPPFGVVIRNLGFVFRHAIPAKRHARRCLDRGRRLARDGGSMGLDTIVAFTAARVALVEKRPDEARRELDACREARCAAGFPEPSRFLRELMDQVGV